MQSFSKVGKHERKNATYARSLASADVVGEARNMARITHKDGSSNLLLRGGRDGNSSVSVALIGIATSAVSIVEDLTTL